MNKNMIIISIFAISFSIYSTTLAGEASTAQNQEGESMKQGLSDTTPIIVTEKDFNKAKEFAEKYIKENYPDYDISCISQMANMSNGHATRQYTLKKQDKDNPEKVETVELYFDIEIAMVEFRKKNRKQIDDTAKKIESHLY